MRSLTTGSVTTSSRQKTSIFTGRNEVVAKVIFLQASVCPQRGGVYLVPGECT